MARPWRRARALDTLHAQISRHAPKRSRASDGFIGDAAHASRLSDHNPWVVVDGVGIVRAGDWTHDPADGFDAGEFADDVRALGKRGHPALKRGSYVISRGRIASPTSRWEWRRYTGSNRHDKHTHVSVSRGRAGFDSTRSWDLDMFRPEAAFEWWHVRTPLANVRRTVGGKVIARKRRGTNLRIRGFRPGPDGRTYAVTVDGNLVNRSVLTRGHR